MYVHIQYIMVWVGCSRWSTNGGVEGGCVTVCLCTGFELRSTLGKGGVGLGGRGGVAVVGLVGCMFVHKVEWGRRASWPWLLMVIKFNLFFLLLIIKFNL